MGQDNRIELTPLYYGQNEAIQKSEMR